MVLERRGKPWFEELKSNIAALTVGDKLQAKVKFDALLQIETVKYSGVVAVFKVLHRLSTELLPEDIPHLPRGLCAEAGACVFGKSITKEETANLLGCALGSASKISSRAVPTPGKTQQASGACVFGNLITRQEAADLLGYALGSASDIVPRAVLTSGESQQYGAFVALNEEEDEESPDWVNGSHEEEVIIEQKRLSDARLKLIPGEIQLPDDAHMSTKDDRDRKVRQCILIEEDSRAKLQYCDGTILAFMMTNRNATRESAYPASRSSSLNEKKRKMRIAK
jgi:hypothetical protein